MNKRKAKFVESILKKVISKTMTAKGGFNKAKLR